MRALTFDGTKVRLDSNHAEPIVAEGEALVRPHRAAILAIDLEAARGRGDFTGTLGHAFVGTIASEGGEHPPGQRVVASMATVCRRCDMCQAGLSPHCRERRLVGVQGRDGCLADAVALPAANLIPVPDDLDDDHAVFAAPLASALQAARQLTIEGKPYITVLGDGPLGLLTVQVMARLNASVRLIGHHAEKLSLCEKWGIKHRHADDVGRRADQDVVVDCTGRADGLELATRFVRPRGTIVLKTMRRRDAAGPGPDLAAIVLNEIELIGSLAGPVAEAVATLARGDIDAVSLISKRMRLDDGPKILQAAARPEIVTVVVDI